MQKFYETRIDYIYQRIKLQFTIFNGTGIYSFQNISINLGGVLRIFNSSCEIIGHALYLNNGSKVEIYQKLVVSALNLHLDNTIIQRNLPIADPVDPESSGRTNESLISFTTSNETYTKVYNNVVMDGSIFVNHGILSMESNSSQMSAVNNIEIDLGKTNTNIASYLLLLPNSTLLINSNIETVVNIPIWSRGYSTIMMHQNSSLFIKNGGICDNYGTFNISNNSTIIFSNSLYVFYPLSQIVGSGSVDIQAAVYPPIKLSELPKIKVSLYGTLYYTNSNITNTRLSYDLDTSNTENNELSNTRNYHVSDILIDGGEISLDRNVSVLSEDMTLSSGSLLVGTNSTIIVDKGIFTYNSGMIGGKLIIWIRIFFIPSLLLYNHRKFYMIYFFDSYAKKCI